MKRPTLFICTLLLLPACSSITPATSHPWQGDMETVIRETEGTPAHNVVTRILEDQQITDIEFEERAQLFAQCMHDAGFTDYIAAPSQGRLGFNSNRPLTESELEKGFTAEKECDRKTGFFKLSPIYFGMIKNPQHLDENELIASCLVKQGVVDQSFSGHDYKEHLDTYLQKSSKVEEKIETDPHNELPFIVDKEEGLKAASRCLFEPQTVLDFKSQEGAKD